VALVNVLSFLVEVDMTVFIVMLDHGYEGQASLAVCATIAVAEAWIVRWVRENEANADDLYINVFRVVEEVS
jgi:hypothetical protein